MKALVMSSPLIPLSQVVPLLWHFTTVLCVSHVSILSHLFFVLLHQPSLLHNEPSQSSVAYNSYYSAHTSKGELGIGLSRQAGPHGTSSPS